MILYTVNDLKIFETRSDMPNADWTGSAEYVIDETNEQNSELINKIFEFAPYFDYVFDDKGNIIDVIKTADKPVIKEYNPIADLQKENHVLREQIEALSAQLDFQEECLVEMAGVVYA